MAKELLKDPHNKVYEICAKLGYFSKQRFYQLFRQHTGVTPIEYRNKVLGMLNE
jgi:two-component system response regulator YesN